ncbi:hypothetical protein A9Q84_03120 [Halobacteriovorax marinus]|uniref:N-acetyltransferase domain-containing protein n=1 Tax=Halobacteriovorax marinus TaxID=97084 RepID=A0A1Y5FDC8_9BACT|nr:hypothetical protein A9Q84_03120 [Halobacteriovorax marinus]
MREFTYTNSSDSFSDSSLIEYRETSSTHKSVIYFANLDSSITELEQQFGNAYKFGMEVNAKDFSPIGEENETTITIADGTSEDLVSSFNEGFKKLEFDKENKEYYLAECKKILETGECKIFSHGENTLGLCLTTDFEIQNNKKTLIAWVWISAKCNTREKESIKHSLSTYLMSKNSNKVASIHNRNVPSLKYFESMKFKRICIIC